MTEAGWLACTDPQPMLRFLQGKATKRQECLFGVACCQRVAHLFEGRRFWTLADGQPYLPQPRQFVKKTERLAERPTSLRFGEYDDKYEDGYADEGHATFAADAALYCSHAERASTYAAWAVSVTREGYEEDYDLIQVAPTLPGYALERAVQAALLRCIVPNPFRPVLLEPSWLTSTVVSLAQTAYKERAFDRLPILADALEEAGCTNDDLLDHCRGPGPHVRGCWVVDLVLGKS
jgi:hypothetical protein